MEREAVLGLLIERIRTVMALDDVAVDETTRFDEDLHADSLDVVEVIESVERALQERGVESSLPDEELVSIRTVGDAADRLTPRT